MTSKEAAFIALVSEVHACRKCARMALSERVLGPASGSIDAELMFIGEAPGRLGADGSGVPFHGDKSGHNFERLIDQVGINRYSVFVTNAVLCNPRDESGNNSTPSKEEIVNCSEFLRRQIETIDPRWVVPLGATALNACAKVDPHQMGLSSHVRTKNKWFGRILIPLYHPGQRAMMHRSFANQLSDYQFVAETARRGKTKRKSSQSYSTVGPRVSDLVAEIAHSRQDLSYFALHKLFFLVEAAALEERGARLTDAYIIRQKDGPYCVALHLAKLNGPEFQVEFVRSGGSLRIRPLQADLLAGKDNGTGLSDEEKLFVRSVAARYSNKTDDALKRSAYLSRSMKTVLRREKALGVNLFNMPLLRPAELE